MSPKTTAIFLLRLDSRRFLGGCDFQATCYNRHLVDTEVLTTDREIFLSGTINPSYFTLFWFPTLLFS